MRFQAQLLRFLLLVTAVLVGHFNLAQAHGIASGNDVSSTASSASFSFAGDREPVIALDGLWRFHPGDNPVWASSDFDDSAWPLLRSDQPWTTQGYATRDGFAWYRFNVQAPTQAMPLALILPSILTDYELFENGKKIGGFGQMPPHGSMRFNQTFLYRLDPAPAGSMIQISIRVWHHPILATYLGGGPRYGGARLGEATLLEDQFRQAQGERLNLVASFFAVGILNAVISIPVFGLYFYRRSEREYLWFAILLLTGALQATLTISSFILHFPAGLSDFLAEAIGAAGVAASLFFFSRLLEVRRSWIWRTVLVAALFDPLNVILYVYRFISPATSTSLRVLFDVPIVIYIVVVLCRRAIAGNRNARQLFVPAILLYGSGILGGALLLAFQIGWRSRTLASINQWNVVERPFPVQLQAFVQIIFIVALLTFLIRRFAASRAMEQRYTADIEAARTLQSVLIPEALPAIPNFDVATAYYPAQEVGGDFYQIFPLQGGSLDSPSDTLIVIGDVAGKGLPAAMTVSMLVGALHSLMETASSPKEILAGLNRRLIGRGTGFTTCLIMRLSPSGNLVFANAGHPAPYFNGKELISPPALPLGLDPRAEFSEQSLQLANEDRLTLITDGVPEATDHGELFGFDRTSRLSCSTADTIAETAIQYGQADDITVISITAKFK